MLSKRSAAFHLAEALLEKRYYLALAKKNLNNGNNSAAEKRKTLTKKTIPNYLFDIAFSPSPTPFCTHACRALCNAILILFT